MFSPEILKKKRQRRGLTYRALAAKMAAEGFAVSHQSVAFWERGMVTPSASALIPLGLALGCKPQSFLKGAKA